MAARRPPLRAYAVCAPGLAPFVAAELRALGIHPGRTDRGGVTFRASHRQLYAANAWLRTSTRVLVRIGSFPARSFVELERGVERLELDGLVRPGAPMRLRVSSSASKLYHTTAIAERVADAFNSTLVTAADDPDFEAQLLVVRVTRDKLTISADSSGLPLYRRGWHVAAGPAPLRETLAAAALAAVGWNGEAASGALVDPMCGAGTIPIEAARLAAGLPPSLRRSYSFEHWPAFEPGTWASVAGELAAAERDRRPVGVAIVASDRDPAAVEATRANAEAAGVVDLIDVAEGPVSALTPPDGVTSGWIVTNPPYGKRVDSGGRDLRNLYAALGNVVRERFAGWRVGLVAADATLVGHTGLGLAPAVTTANGGIDVAVYTPPDHPS